MYSTANDKTTAWVAKMDRLDQKIAKAVDKATKALKRVDRYLEQPKK